MKRILIFTLLCLLTLAACSTPASAPVPDPTVMSKPFPTTAVSLARVLPLSTILTNAPEFNPTAPDTLTVHIQTNIPVACAVVYGETTGYGGIVTDPNMAGGAITDHHPILNGLKPDTLYHSRLQGSDAAGTLYVSDDYTFRTPPLSASAQAKPQGKNVALIANGAKVSGVSSNYGGGDNTSAYGANNAIDGNPATQWSSNGDGDKAWIEITFAAPTHLTQIGFRTRTMGSTAQIEQLQVSTADGKIFGPFDLPDANQVYYFPLDATTQTLRFQALKSSGGNTGAAEIEAYTNP